MHQWITRSGPVGSVVVGTILVMIPALMTLLLALTGETWFPGGDMAQAELHMRGFFSHPPLVGAAGRIVSDSGIQGSHPGPSLWVAMLPVYLLGGRTSAGLMAAVVSVHLVSVAAILWLAYRRGGRALMWAMGVAIVAIFRSAGPDFVIEPWNPWLAVLPFAVFVFLIGEVIRPSSPSWSRSQPLIFAGAVLVGSHCIQCHAGYVVIVVAGLVLALLGMRLSAGPGWRLLVRSGTVGALAGLVIWLPPLLDQLRRSPGNFDILWQHFASPAEPAMSWAQAIREITTQVNVIGPWLTGPGADIPAMGWARYLGCAVLLGVWVGCWRVSRVRHWTDTQTVLSVTGALTLVGALAISRIFGPFFEYTIRWMWILMAITVATCAVVMVRLGKASDLQRHWRMGGAGVLAVLGALLVGTTYQLMDRFTLPGPTDSRITQGLHQQLDQVLDPDVRYLVRFYDPYTLNATGFGTTLALERSGFDVGVDPNFAAAALPHRIRQEESADLILWVVVGPANGRARVDNELRQIAYFDPRSADEQVRGDELLREIAAGLRRVGRDELLGSLDAPGASLLFAEPPLPADIAALVRELVLLGQPVGVYSIPPGLAPVSLQ